MRWAWIGSSLLCACAPAELLEVPTEGATSLLVTTFSADVPSSAYALPVDADARPFVTVPRPRPKGDAVYVADFACPLDGLGLTPGPVPLDPLGPAMPTPSRLRRYRAELDPSLGVVDDPTALDQVTYQATPPESACRGYQLGTRLLSATGPLSAIVPDGEALLLVSPLQLFFQYFADERLLPLPTWGGSPAQAAVRGPDGWIYLAGGGGRVERRRGTESEVLPTFPESTGRVWIDVAGETEPALLLLSGRGSLGWLRGGGWSLIGSGTGTSTLTSGAVAVAGADEGWVVGLKGTGPGNLGHVRGDRVELEAVNLDGRRLGAIRTVTRTPSGRILLGAETGELAERRGEGWVLLADLEIPVRVIAERDENLVVGSVAGQLREVGPDGLPCPPMIVDVVDTQSARTDILALVPWERGLAALTIGAGFPTDVSFVTRLEPGARLRRPRCQR